MACAPLHCPGSAGSGGAAPQLGGGLVVAHDRAMSVAAECRHRQLAHWMAPERSDPVRSEMGSAAVIEALLPHCEADANDPDFLEVDGKMSRSNCMPSRDCESAFNAGARAITEARLASACWRASKA